jgi:hypothetical protein
VRSVEVRTDAGAWQRAEIRPPNLVKYTWVRFTQPWNATASHHVIETRTAANNGTTQPEIAPLNSLGRLTGPSRSSASKSPDVHTRGARGPSRLPSRCRVTVMRIAIAALPILSMFAGLGADFGLAAPSLQVPEGQRLYGELRCLSRR